MLYVCKKGDSMLRYFRENKLLNMGTAFFSTIASLSYVLIAVILQRILDAAIQKDLQSFAKILLFSLGYFVLMGLLMYVYTYLSKKLICGITQQLRKKSFVGIVNHTIEDFGKANTSDYLSAITNDVKLVEDNYLLPLMEIIQYGVIFTASLVLMLYYDVIVTGCVLVSILFMFIIPSLFGATLQKRQDNYSRQLSGFTGTLKDFLSGFEVIKAYRMRIYVIKKFEDSNVDLTSAKFSVDKSLAANEAVSMLLSVMVQIVVLFLSAYFIIIGRITVGTMLAMVQVSGNLSNPLLMIFNNAPKLKGVRPVIARLNEFADHRGNSFTGEVGPLFEHQISVEKLNFSYDKTHNALQDVSLTIERGKKYALVGASGCGKTTLIKLLTGYYSDYQGTVKYDDCLLSDLDYEQVAELSSTIHQNVYMFNETIEDNICLHQTYDDAEMETALKTSGVDLFLNQTTQGLSSPVGENGTNLSGGQKQRIAVARAIVRKKPLLILDEGTSAVDMQTAYDIESRLLKLEDLTLLTITHNMRKDLLELYDEIIYMENGKIAEKGPFEELMKMEGKFNDFFQLKK